MNRMLLLAVAVCCTAGVAAAHGDRATGVTAGGKQVSSGPGEEPPWKTDIVRWVGPEYPNRDRYIGNEGTGYFRLSFDVKTGEVLKVLTLRSTGYASLDKAATTALEQWRVKPGSWRTFDVPITYAWAPTQGAAMARARRLRDHDGKTQKQARPRSR